MKTAIKQRVFVLYYANGSSVAIPIDDRTVITVKGSSFSLQDCTGGFISEDDGSLASVFDDEAA